MGFATAGDLKPSISVKKHFRPTTITISSTATEHTHEREWPLSDVSSDLTVEVQGAKFFLHKAHPNIKESECYRLCKTIDCQKLSQDACSHAAQNERLPIQMAVQVLYFEQIRLRNALNGEGNHQHQHQFFSSADSHQNFHKLNCGVGSGTMSPRDNYASVRRENRELKMEVARMRMRLNDLEKDHISMKQELIRSNPASNMLSSFARKLSKLHALFRTKDGKSISSKKAHIDARFPFQKHWRHSVS